MTKYERIEKAKENINLAIKRTTGKMRAIWIDKLVEVEELQGNMTIAEAMEAVK